MPRIRLLLLVVVASLLIAALTVTGQLVEPARAARPAQTAVPPELVRQCELAAKRLEAQLGDDCQVIVKTPFVLAGDYSRDELAQVYRDTIAPTVRAMKACYLRTPPSGVITVLVFQDEGSYTHYSEELYNDRGVSVYGYYKPDVRTLVMNLGTGTGTLVHELTHALVDFDFPDVPDWFNEGLASLHEQCRFREGPRGPWIQGLVNWRLPALQKVVRAKELGSLESLVENPRFRGAGVGTNYAQARYFCMYLQERELLADYYRAFRDGHQQDPTGLKTLKRIMPKQTLEELNADFQRWVLTLDAKRDE
jgi:hypothetical protein